MKIAVGYYKLSNFKNSFGLKRGGVMI